MATPFACFGDSGFVEDGVLAFELLLLAGGGVAALGAAPFICTGGNDGG